MARKKVLIKAVKETDRQQRRLNPAIINPREQLALSPSLSRVIPERTRREFLGGIGRDEIAPPLDN